MGIAMRPDKSAGFTLIEVVVAIAIAGILAVLAVPNFLKLVEKTKLNAAANTIKRQMLSARTRAIADPYKHCGLAVDVSNQKTYIFFDSLTPYTINTTDTVNKYTGVFIMPGTIIMSIPTGGSGIQNNCVVFRGDGSAKYGGSVQVTNKYNATKTINVVASTGRVKVQ